MLPHYAAAGGFGQGGTSDPKTTGVFGVPLIGGIVQTLALVLWGSIPLFNVPLSLATAWALVKVYREEGRLAHASGHSYMNVMALVIMLGGLMLYFIIGNKVMEWVVD